MKPVTDNMGFQRRDIKLMNSGLGAISMQEATSCITCSQSMLVRIKSICPKLAGINAEHGLEPTLYTVTCRLGGWAKKVLPTTRSSASQSSSKSCRFDSGWDSAEVYPKIYSPNRCASVANRVCNLALKSPSTNNGPCRDNLPIHSLELW